MDRQSPLAVPRVDRSRSPSPNRDGRTLYFAYGTNLWHKQMQQRCPSATIIGIARLRHWRWQINTKGFANIVEAPKAPFAPGVTKWLGPLGGDLREDKDRVYGCVYRLEKDDERVLNMEMGPAGRGYEKVTDVLVEFWGRATDGMGRGMPADLANGRIQKVKVVMYVDRETVADGPGKAKGDYLYALQAGVRDAVAQGIPQKYFDEYMDSYLPKEEEGSQLSLAIQEAMKRGVDVKKMVERAESKLTLNGTAATASL